MINRAIILFLLAALFVAPAHGAGDTLPVASGTVPASLIRRLPPLYPAKAVERGQEGWVDVSFTITPEGTTSNIRVVAEYPRHVFARSALNAVAKWTYTPRNEGGVAIPQENNRAVLSFALRDRTAISPQHMQQFEAARDAIATHSWDTATAIILELGNSEGLNLFELATLEEFKGRLAFGRQLYMAAGDCLTRALQITTHFSPETRDNLFALLIRARINSGEYAKAVVAYDRWNPAPRDDIRDLHRAVETARAALAAGREAGLQLALPAGGDR